MDIYKAKTCDSEEGMRDPETLLRESCTSAIFKFEQSASGHMYAAAVLVK